MSFAHSQASYAASQLNKVFKNDLHNQTKDEYVNKLNEAFVGLSTFSMENDIVTVTNYTDEIKVYGTRKEESKR